MFSRCSLNSSCIDQFTFLWCPELLDKKGYERKREWIDIMAMDNLLPHHLVPASTSRSSCSSHSPLTESSLLPHPSMMDLLYSEDVQWILLWLLQWLWPRTHAMALSPPEKIRVSQGEAMSPSKLSLWCTTELSSLNILPSLRKAKWFGDGFYGMGHLRATAIRV